MTKAQRSSGMITGEVTDSEAVLRNTEKALKHKSKVAQEQWVRKTKTIQRSNRAEHRRSKQLVSQTTHGSQVTDLPGANEQVTNPSPCLRNKKGKKGNSSIKDNWLTAPLRKQLV